MRRELAALQGLANLAKQTFHAGIGNILQSGNLVALDLRFDVTLNAFQHIDFAPGQQTDRLALAPGAMLTPSMLGQQDEHLERAFDTLAEFAPFLYLYDVAVDDSGENLLPVPLGEGELDGEIVRQLIQSAWPSNKPIVLRSQRLAEQCTWLAGDV